MENNGKNYFTAGLSGFRIISIQCRFRPFLFTIVIGEFLSENEGIDRNVCTAYKGAVHIETECCELSQK